MREFRGTTFIDCFTVQLKNKDKGLNPIIFIIIAIGRFKKSVGTKFSAKHWLSKP